MLTHPCSVHFTMFHFVVAYSSCSQDLRFLNMDLTTWTMYFENSTFGIIVGWSVRVTENGLVDNPTTADIQLYTCTCRSYAWSSCTSAPVSPVTTMHEVTADPSPAAIPSRDVQSLTISTHAMCITTVSFFVFDVRLSHLNKDYLLRTVIIQIDKR